MKTLNFENKESYTNALDLLFEYDVDYVTLHLDLSVTLLDEASDELLERLEKL